jgi:small subunit ribosomal protein S3Ae
MTQGKNPRNFKKKGQRKKVQHPFAKKNWYTVLAPSVFETREACLTPVTKSAGGRKESNRLKGRVFEISLADLKTDMPEMSWRKIQLQVEAIEGSKCYTSFYGMSMTRDRLCHIVKKWQSTIESFVDVKTQDGYFLRIFALAFTQRRKTQLKATCYASSCQKAKIRKKMREIIVEEAKSCNLKQVAGKFVDRIIEQRIGKECNKIFPLQNIYLKRVKMLKKPRFDFSRLMDMYSDKAGAARVIDDKKKKEEAQAFKVEDKTEEQAE